MRETPELYALTVACALLNPTEKLIATTTFAANMELALTDERALADSVATALRDALSTFRDDDKTTLITAERKEAWAQVLADYDKLRADNREG